MPLLPPIMLDFEHSTVNAANPITLLIYLLPSGRGPCKDYYRDECRGSYVHTARLS